MDKDGAVLDEYSFTDQTHNVISSESEKLEESQVVDTCCAGDTFVGGYLYGYLTNKSHEESMRVGHKVAAKIVQRIGCYFE